MSLTNYLSVADNARDAVLLHVPASSERQECGNETGPVTERTQQQIVTHTTAMPVAPLAFSFIQ
jgi:hypothetical protein